MRPPERSSRGLASASHIAVCMPGSQPGQCTHVGARLCSRRLEMPPENVSHGICVGLKAIPGTAGSGGKGTAPGIWDIL